MPERVQTGEARRAWAAPRVWLAAALLLLAACSHSGPGPVNALQAAFPTQHWRVHGADGLLEATLYRPEGRGPFPTVILSHGSARTPAGARAMRQPLPKLAAWFVARGYAVLAPVRRGFGDSPGPMVENVLHGWTPTVEDYIRSANSSADDVAAAMRFIRDQPFVDRDRIVLVGVSAGGYTSVALAARRPEGVRAVVSFAGGRGSTSPGVIAGGYDTLIAATASFAPGTGVPELWLYSSNDRIFPPDLARRLYDAFKAGTTAPVRFVTLPPYGEDGHAAVNDPSLWADEVTAFLASVPGLGASPTATGGRVASASPAR
jgi:dienelactone hydrolase